MVEESTSSELHPRHDWLDQARGLVVIMLIVSMGTAEFAGDMVLGEPVIGPPMLNHGYDYYHGAPAIITFVDVGQALFVFVMGFVGYAAFTSRLTKRGPRSAFLYAARRVLVLYALAGLDSILLSTLERGSPEWAVFFYGGTFSAIALGSLVAFVSIVIIPNADRRAAFAAALVLLHALLFEFPIFDRYTWYDDVLGLPKFPFGAAGLAIVAIFGSSFGQWYVIDPDEPLAGFKQRMVPVSTAAVIAAYCMDWLQPAEHHDVTASLQLQAIYMGGFMLEIFYTFGRAGFRFPLLSSFGKNLLLMFAVGGFGVSIYWNFLPKELLIAEPLIALFLVGILPIAALGVFAKFLEKRGVMVRA
ncbi:MAG: hypothetical protein HUU46_17180 [Candidatus Hydrogenedentes bacterium]|nr:hypothetical protein [Candidatus Hydrogenedentota bacterium]